MTNRDHERNPDESISEEVIAANFKTYRSYLEQHVHVSDLIVYYEPFKEEDRENLFIESKHATQGVIRTAFYLIEHMTSVDKYMQLLLALDKAERPKLVDLLKGMLVPCGNGGNRKRINAAREHLYKRLTPSNVVPYLESYGVITSDEGQYLTNKESKESRSHAALELLYMLPNRRKDWYTLFLKALVYGDEYSNLAELIDERKTREIKKRRDDDIETISVDSGSSLQPSIKKQEDSDIETVSVDSGSSPQPPKNLEEDMTQIQTRMTDSIGAMSSYGTSDEQTDPFCDSCFKDRTVRLVACYCPKCVEFYCQSCLAAHRCMAVSERREILLRPDVLACQADKPVKYQLCDKHDGEDKDRYCFDHGITICGVCYIREHKLCQVKEVSDACKSFNMSAEKASFSADVGILLKHIKETSQSVKSNKAKLEKKKQDILTDAQKQRDELLKKVHQSYQDFSVEVISLLKDHITTLSERQSRLDEIAAEVYAILQSLQQTGQKKQNNQRDFLELHYYSEKIQLCEDKIKLLNLRLTDIKCTFNTNIQPLILTKNRFGEFSLQMETFKYSTELPGIHYPYKRPCPDPHNTVPGPCAMRGHPVLTWKLKPLDTINVKISDDKEDCNILRVDITVDGNMLLADNSNCKVKLFSPDGTLLSFLEPPEEPVDVAVINKSEAAVRMDKQQIGIMDIADSSHLSMTRIIKRDRFVCGITNYNNNLIIICCESKESPRSVQMIDMNGKILWTTITDTEFDCARSLTTCSGDDGDTVIVTDLQNQTITVLHAGTGKVVKVCDVKGKKPVGVTADDNGNVYVCYNSGEITVWSREMQEETRLTTGGRYLKYPGALVYNSRRSELVVTSTSTHTLYCNFIHRFMISTM